MFIGLSHGEGGHSLRQDDFSMREKHHQLLAVEVPSAMTASYRDRRGQPVRTKKARISRTDTGYQKAHAGSVSQS